MRFSHFHRLYFIQIYGSVFESAPAVIDFACAFFGDCLLLFMCIFLELFTCLMTSPSPEFTFDWLSSISFLEVEMLLWFEVTEEAFEGVTGKLGSRNFVAYLKRPSHCFR